MRFSSPLRTTSPPFPLPPGLLHAQPDRAPQFRPDFSNLPIVAFLGLELLLNKAVHLGAEVRLLLQNELHCLLDVHSCSSNCRGSAPT